MIRLVKIVGAVLCVLAVEAQAFDVIKVDQAVKKLFQGFFAADGCAFSYSYKSIRYVKDSERYPEFELEYLPDDIEVELEEADFCSWSDGYWIGLRAIGDEYEVTGYSSFSQTE